MRFATKRFSTAVQLSNQLVKLIFHTISTTTDFFVMNWLILYDSYNMSHHIYDVIIAQWFWYDVIITQSIRNIQNDSYHHRTHRHRFVIAHESIWGYQNDSYKNTVSISINVIYFNNVILTLCAKTHWALKQYVIKYSFNITH